MRIHIGRISDALAANIGDLESRLDRFGERQGSLSLHRKEFGDHHFAFVDMNIDQKQYASLTKALNGMMFRQSKLQIKEARPSFTELMKKQDEEKKIKLLNPEQTKRLKSYKNRVIDVYPGRFRESSTVRPNPTFRVKINDEIRKPKMRKRKLWGIERRPLDRLVCTFVDGEWRDAENRAVEIVDALHDEHAKAERIAADYAKAGAYLSDSDFEEFRENARELEEVESDNDIEIVPAVSSGVNTNRIIDLDSDLDEEDSVRTTSTVGRPIQINSLHEDLSSKNTTESLRTALSAEAPFALFGSADAKVEADSNDIIAKQNMKLADHAPEQTEHNKFTQEPPTLGLFFSHKSPYLRSQAEEAKLVADFDSKAWETEFYENRGEWNRSIRKRRRDAARTARRMGKRRGE